MPPNTLLDHMGRFKSKSDEKTTTPVDGDLSKLLDRAHELNEQRKKIEEERQELREQLVAHFKENGIERGNTSKCIGTLVQQTRTKLDKKKLAQDVDLSKYEVEYDVEFIRFKNIS